MMYCIQTTVLGAALCQGTRHERHLHKSVLQVKVKTQSIISKDTAAASRSSQPGNGKGGHSLCSAQLSWH